MNEYTLIGDVTTCLACGKPVRLRATMVGQRTDIVAVEADDVDQMRSHDSEALQA